MSLVICVDGLVHEILDHHGTVCGRFHPSMGTAEAGAVLSCFACMHPDLVKDCGHPDATVGNCPYAADVNNNREQRCRCCKECSHECAMDI